MSQQNNDISTKWKLIMTCIPCVLVVVYLFGFEHPEQIKAWRDSMATKDCTHLANYLVNVHGSPNYTKIGSDNVQFVYSIYKEKKCFQ